MGDAEDTRADGAAVGASEGAHAEVGASADASAARATDGTGLPSPSSSGGDGPRRAKKTRKKGRRQSMAQMTANMKVAALETMLQRRQREAQAALAKEAAARRELELIAARRADAEEAAQLEQAAAREHARAVRREQRRAAHQEKLRKSAAQAQQRMEVRKGISWVSWLVTCCCGVVLVLCLGVVPVSFVTAVAVVACAVPLTYRDVMRWRGQRVLALVCLRATVAQAARLSRHLDEPAVDEEEESDEPQHKLPPQHRHAASKFARLEHVAARAERRMRQARRARRASIIALQAATVAHAQASVEVAQADLAANHATAAPNDGAGEHATTSQGGGTGASGASGASGGGGGSSTHEVHVSPLVMDNHAAVGDSHVAAATVATPSDGFAGPIANSHVELQASLGAAGQGHGLLHTKRHHPPTTAPHDGVHGEDAPALLAGSEPDASQPLPFARAAPAPTSPALAPALAPAPAPALASGTVAPAAAGATTVTAAPAAASASVDAAAAAHPPSGDTTAVHHRLSVEEAALRRRLRELAAAKAALEASQDAAREEQLQEAEVTSGDLSALLSVPVFVGDEGSVGGAGSGGGGGYGEAPDGRLQDHVLQSSESYSDVAPRHCGGATVPERRDGVSGRVNQVTSAMLLAVVTRKLRRRMDAAHRHDRDHAASNTDNMPSADVSRCWHKVLDDGTSAATVSCTVACPHMRVCVW